MQLPGPLAEAVDAQLAGLAPLELERAAVELSHAYREKGRPLRSLAERRAYLAVRLPATFAAARAALEATAAGLSIAPESLLDLGAGPGTATWAAAAVWPQLQRATLVECDAGMVELGRALMQDAPPVAATWLRADLAARPALAVHDLVIASYALGELPERTAQSVLAAALVAARVAVVLIEPGTPRGFERLRAWRDAGLSHGLSVVAPCPHDAACPMEGADWCHFAARVERSRRHRLAKRALLGHEDEKFSYIALARPPVLRAEARIVRHPVLRGGHGHLDLCTTHGLERITVTRSDGAAWKALRRSGWGDAWTPQAPAGDEPTRA